MLTLVRKPKSKMKNENERETVGLGQPLSYLEAILHSLFALRYFLSELASPRGILVQLDMT